VNRFEWRWKWRKFCEYLFTLTFVVFLLILLRSYVLCLCECCSLFGFGLVSSLVMINKIYFNSVISSSMNSLFLLFKFVDILFIFSNYSHYIKS
jgi:hypothetical protein